MNDPSKCPTCGQKVVTEPIRAKFHDACGEFHVEGTFCSPPLRPAAQRPEGTWKAEYLKVKRPSKVIDRAAEAARRVETVELPSEERA